VPPADPGELDRAVDAATAYVARQGVTSVHAMGSWEDLAAYERARDAGRLRTRVYAAVPLETWARLRDTVAAWHAQGHRLTGGLAGDRWLQIGGLKGFVDGSLGAHTAAMLAPYDDARDDRGLFVTPRDSLFEWTRAAAVAGLQVMVHAIGDRAIRTQLDVFERVAGEVGARDRRWRLEHAQHFDPADVPRVAALGVVASMQPYHAIDDGRWAERVVGPARAQLTYAFRALLDARARLAFGSDWFVAPPTPLEGIYAAVTRRTLDGRHPDGWVPGQRITVDEALRAYTAGGAYARFAEAELGTLEAGKLADFVLVDRDLTRVPPATIRDARVVLTVVGGRVVFEAPAPTTGR
jgi:predicted amidohydrolase YtcJ